MLDIPLLNLQGCVQIFLDEIPVENFHYDLIDILRAELGKFNNSTNISILLIH